MTDLIPNDLSHMSDADFNALCPQGHHAPGPEPLSPAAQAVLDAYMNNCGWLDGPLEKDYRCAAAVVRAAADQVMPRTSEPKGAKPTAAWHRWNVTAALRLNLLAIATELEVHQ